MRNAILIICLSILFGLSACEEESKGISFAEIEGSHSVGYRISKDSIGWLSTSSMTSLLKLHVAGCNDSRRNREADASNGLDAVEPGFAIDSMDFDQVYPLILDNDHIYLAAKGRYQNGQEKFLLASSLSWQNDSLIIDKAGTFMICMVKNSCNDPAFKIENKTITNFTWGNKASSICEPYISIQNRGEDASSKYNDPERDSLMKYSR